MSGLWHDDFKAAGWLSYTDSLKGHRGDEFYKGSWQRRVTDEDGTRYFINVNLYVFDGRQSVAAEVQFYTNDEAHDAINVERSWAASIPALEAFYANIWAALELGYYERSDRSPVLAREGR